ncbi:hypothetical protein INT45_001997 [Circinella minor]|uniref:Uncharacterized protein n=1 Tax=Circinella minor TaxID=1195481 RepID=A0A8H7R632_9FUNG|nr:hypothetical protein INT45_001997 [Circinella minor]
MYLIQRSDHSLSIKSPTPTIFSSFLNENSSASHTVFSSGSTQQSAPPSSSSLPVTEERPSAEERIRMIFRRISHWLNDVSYGPNDKEELHRLVDEKLLGFEELANELGTVPLNKRLRTQH